MPCFGLVLKTHTVSVNYELGLVPEIWEVEKVG